MRKLKKGRSLTINGYKWDAQYIKAELSPSRVKLIDVIAGRTELDAKITEKKYQEILCKTIEI